MLLFRPVPHVGFRADPVISIHGLGTDPLFAMNVNSAENASEKYIAARKPVKTSSWPSEYLSINETLVTAAFT
jgi:hypothetical protein